MKINMSQKHKYIVIFSAFIFGVFSCVPAKKFNELLEKEKACAESLAKYKNNNDMYESQAKDCIKRKEVLQKDLNRIKKELVGLQRTVDISGLEIEKLRTENQELESSFSKLSQMEAREVAAFQAEVEAKNRELQKKEDALMELEKQLREKERLLIEREKRVNELEELIKNRERAIQAMKDKIAAALRAYENSGLTVEQRNGKIYISMEAKLLFASGSTSIEPKGKKAIIELASVIGNEKDWEIVVEGHTDSDKLNRGTHPKNNWELSVLRSTAVVEIMLEKSALLPSQIMAAGRSEFHPVDKNNKAKNRRIEVIISPNLNELFEIISN